MLESTLTVLFHERAGALDRIVGLLRRRDFPVTGMSLERTHRENVRRMTVCIADSSALAQTVRHLNRLHDVLDVTVTDEHTVRREHALVRLICPPALRSEVLAVLSSFDAHPIAISATHMVVEAVGSVEHVDALFEALSAFSIEEAARTHPIALGRMSPESASVDGIDGEVATSHEKQSA